MKKFILVLVMVAVLAGTAFSQTIYSHRKEISSDMALSLIAGVLYIDANDANDINVPIYYVVPTSASTAIITAGNLPTGMTFTQPSTDRSYPLTSYAFLYTGPDALFMIPDPTKWIVGFGCLKGKPAQFGKYMIIFTGKSGTGSQRMAVTLVDFPEPAGQLF